MAGVHRLFMLNFITTLTRTLDNGDIGTKVIHRVFYMIPYMMLASEDFARARLEFATQRMLLPKSHPAVCARIMHIIRCVRRGSFYNETASLPFTTLCVTLDHGAITSIVSEFDDEIVLSLKGVNDAGADQANGNGDGDDQQDATD